jgi:hypothetical protein
MAQAVLIVDCAANQPSPKSFFGNWRLGPRSSLEPGPTKLESHLKASKITDFGMG